MNTIHNNGENDTSLNDDLKKLGHAYDQLPNEEPPELLDQAILNSAHRAVEKKPHWMKFGWLHGLTTAAVVVLTLSIIINQREQVPGLDDAVRVEETTSLKREKARRKQSGADQPEDLRKEFEKESPDRQPVPANAAVSATTESETGEVPVGKYAPEPESRSRYSATAKDSVPVKSDRADADKAINEKVLEDPMMDEVDLADDAAEYKLMTKQPQAAVIGVLEPEDVRSAMQIDAKIEEQLLSIIKLKQSGDAAWITQLEKFRQAYPDYPLPEALSD